MSPHSASEEPDKSWIHLLTRESIFLPHPALPWVEISQLSIDDIPPCVRYVIRTMSGKIISFLEIRIQQEVPLHQHIDDGEIYFWGDSHARVILQNPWEQKQTFSMWGKSYTIVKPGWFHGVLSAHPTTFFGAKFTISTDTTNWAKSPPPQ